MVVILKIKSYIYIDKEENIFSERNVPSFLFGQYGELERNEMDQIRIWGDL